MGGQDWARPGEHLADDGPPAQPPGPPPLPAIRDGDDRRDWRGALLVVGLLIALIGLVTAGVVVAADGDDPVESAEPAEDTDTPSSTSSTATTTTTTTRPTTTTEPPLRTVTGADGAFQVGLPPEWGAITVAGDMAGRGGEMFPDDPERAALAEQVLTILPTAQTRFIALDGDSPPFVEDTDILLVESGPANVGQQEAYDLAKQHTEAPIQREGTVTTPAGIIGWFEFAPEGLPGMVARKYVLVHGGTGWVLTYWSGDMASGGPTADRIMGSFTPS